MLLGGLSTAGRFYNLRITGLTAAAGDDWSIDGCQQNITLGCAPITADSVAIWSGNDYEGRNTAPFRLTTDGQLIASSATITGTVTATSGAIGNWELIVRILIMVL